MKMSKYKSLMRLLCMMCATPIARRKPVKCTEIRVKGGGGVSQACTLRHLLSQIATVFLWSNTTWVLRPF